ncbi:MAG: sulfite exporter TauE/SafE family protein [Enterobacteriaceae bacterium]
MLSVLLYELSAGAVLGLVISTTSVGGGILVLPALSYIFGLSALEAVATANLFSMLVKIPSSVMHYRLGNIPPRQSTLFFIYMIPGTLIFSFLLSWLSNNPLWHAQIQYLLTGLIVIAILFSLYLYCRRMWHFSENSHPELDSRATKKLILSAIATGSLIGVTGIGGSVIMLPILLRYAAMNIKQAIGCSVFITMLLSGGAAWIYSYGHHTNVTLAGMLFVGSLLTLPLAQHLLRVLSERTLQALTFLLILGSALLMLYRLF